jgi:hypothetical protein
MAIYVAGRPAASSGGTTLRYGSGPPDNAVGNDGDSYVDRTNGRLYGPKTAGAWGGFQALGGPAGAVTVFAQQTQPSGLEAPAIWIPTHGDDTMKSVPEWQVFTVDPTPGVDLSKLYTWWTPRFLSATDGLSVPTVSDFSLHGRTLTNDNPATQPIYTANEQNGQPVLRFNAASNQGMGFIPSAGDDQHQPCEIFAAYRIRTDINVGRSAIISCGSFGIAWEADADGGARTFLFQFGTWVQTPATSLPLTWHIWHFILDGANSSIDVDGVPLAGGAGDIGANGLPVISLGTDSGGGLPTDIDWGDLVITNQLLTGSERTSTLNTLKTVWGTP